MPDERTTVRVQQLRWQKRGKLQTGLEIVSRGVCVKPAN